MISHNCFARGAVTASLDHTAAHLRSSHNRFRHSRFRVLCRRITSNSSRNDTPERPLLSTIYAFTNAWLDTLPGKHTTSDMPNRFIANWFNNAGEGNTVPRSDQRWSKVSR